MRKVGWLRIALLAAALIAAAAGGGLWLSRLDSTVTRWHVPYQVAYDGQTFPLYDSEHCLQQADLQREKLRRAGTASGLPRFVPPGREVEVVYVQPHGFSCLMRYASLSNIG
jgi:hypothetical protein